MSRARRRYRIQPSEDAGYGPGRFVVQYFDPTARIWFDLGDPFDSRAEAADRIAGEE